jgi:hypothetical protein
LSGFSYLHQLCDTGLIDVDGEAACARHGVMEANRPSGADGLNVVFGAYEDEYRLLADGWRFQRRRFSLDFRVLLSASELQEFALAAPGLLFSP